MSTSAEPQRLLLVDYDGNILYDLQWHEGRYVTDRHAEGAATLADDVAPLISASPTPMPVASTVSNAHGEALQDTFGLAILTEIQEKFEEIENAVLTNPDGQILSALHPQKAGELATVAILAWSFLRHTTEILDCGDMREILLRDAERILVMYPLAERAMLSVVIPAEANLGMLHWVCREALEKIAQTLTA